jgi:hypothetical protein
MELAPVYDLSAVNQRHFRHFQFLVQRDNGIKLAVVALRAQKPRKSNVASDYGNSTTENAVGNSKLCFWASTAIQGLPSPNCSAEEKAPTVLNS